MEPLDKFYSIQEVQNSTGLSRSTIWDKVARGTFPAPIKLSANRSAWRHSDLIAWQAALPLVKLKRGSK